MGAPLFMPPMLRSRIGLCDEAPARTARAPQSIRVRRRLVETLTMWFGLATALSIGCCALVYIVSAGRDASAITTWVAGVVAALGFGFCALFIGLGHRVRG